MSKIVQAVNIMISNPNKITNIIKRGDIIYFLYLGKQKWSIGKHETSDGLVEYIIHYYTGEKNLEQLSTLPYYELANEKYVAYSTEDIKTREAMESFKQLYMILNEMIVGIDDVFKEIVDSNEAESF